MDPDGAPDDQYLLVHLGEGLEPTVMDRPQTSRTTELGRPGPDSVPPLRKHRVRIST